MEAWRIGIITRTEIPGADGERIRFGQLAAASVNAVWPTALNLGGYPRLRDVPKRVDYGTLAAHLLRFLGQRGCLTKQQKCRNSRPPREAASSRSRA